MSLSFDLSATFVACVCRPASVLLASTLRIKLSISLYSAVCCAMVPEIAFCLIWLHRPLHLPLPSGQDWCCGDHLGNDALSLLGTVLGQHGIKDRRCDLLSCFSSYEPLRLRLQTCFLGSAALLRNGSCRDRFRSRSRSPARCMAAQSLLCATCFSKQWLHWCGTRPSWSQIIPPSVLRLMLCRRLDEVSCQKSSHHCYS